MDPEETARSYMESLRWPDGAVACPHCRAESRSYRLAPGLVRLGLWKCGACRRQFTVTVGTAIEGSKLPLGKWLDGIRLVCAGASAAQVQRELGLTYKSAWYVVRRLGPVGIAGLGFEAAVEKVLRTTPEDALAALERVAAEYDDRRRKLRSPVKQRAASASRARSASDA